MHYPNKGQKMTSKNVSPATELDASLMHSYESLIEAGQYANGESLAFILELNNRLETGLTQAVASASMKALLKDANIKPIVKPSHIPSITTSAVIIDHFRDEIQAVPAGKVLSLGARVLADVKAENVVSFVTSFATYAELDENTRSKAESQAEAEAVAQDEAVKELASGITFESIVDGFTTYLGENDLTSLTTSELAKLHALIAKLITVEKNTKALAK